MDQIFLPLEYLDLAALDTRIYRMVDLAHRNWRRREVRQFFLQRVELHMRQPLLERVSATLADLDPQLPQVAALDPAVTLQQELTEERPHTGAWDASAPWLMGAVVGLSVVAIAMGLFLVDNRQQHARTWAERVPAYMREKLRRASLRVNVLTDELRVRFCLQPPPPPKACSFHSNVGDCVQVARVQLQSAEQAALYNQRLLTCTSATAVIFGVAHLLLRARR
ncbi:MAG: hypothetical protein SGPRY_010991 [Prymnesium sp.]